MAKGLSAWLNKGKKPGLTMERGNIARARRDVLARKLGKHSNIKTPYALSTYMVERGAKVGTPSEIGLEFESQKKAKAKSMARGK